jgi:hypothetical protein
VQTHAKLVQQKTKVKQEWNIPKTASLVLMLATLVAASKIFKP